MGAIVNGLALHGGIVRPSARPSSCSPTTCVRPIRLSALMGLRVVWVFIHDSLASARTGPTHQPVEHLAALRAIPRLTVLRPADAAETAEAWRVILEELDGPGSSCSRRQNVPVLDRAGALAGAGGLATAPTAADADRRRGDRRPPVRRSRSRWRRATCSPARGSRRASCRCRAGSSSRRRTREYRDDAPARRCRGLDRGGVDVRLGPLGRTLRSASTASARSAPGAEVLEHFGITAAAAAQAVRDVLGA